MNTDIEKAVRNLVDSAIDHDTKQAIRNVLGHIFENEAESFRDYTGIDPHNDNEGILENARKEGVMGHVYGQAVLVHKWLTDLTKK